jgi:hypothetical protein
MGSKKGRKLANWSTPEGWLMKGVINYFWVQKGYRTADVLGPKIKYLFPNYREYLGGEITNVAVYNRGDKGTRKDNATEHPDKHPMGMKFLADAERIALAGKPVSREEVAAIVERNMAEKISAEKAPVLENTKDFGYIYFLGMVGSTNGAFGISVNPHERIQAFRKGDIDDKMEVVTMLWTENPRRIETAMKQCYAHLSNGNERYAVPPGHLVHFAKTFADKHRMICTEMK